MKGQIWLYTRNTRPKTGLQGRFRSIASSPWKCCTVLRRHGVLSWREWWYNRPRRQWRSESGQVGVAKRTVRGMTGRWFWSAGHKLPWGYFPRRVPPFSARLTGRKWLLGRFRGQCAGQDCHTLGRRSANLAQRRKRSWVGWTSGRIVRHRCGSAVELRMD